MPNFIYFMVPMIDGSAGIGSHVWRDPAIRSVKEICFDRENSQI